MFTERVLSKSVWAQIVPVMAYLSTTYDCAYPVFDKTRVGGGKADDAVDYEDLQEDDLLAVEAALILFRRDHGVKLLKGALYSTDTLQSGLSS